MKIYVSKTVGDTAHIAKEWLNRLVEGYSQGVVPTSAYVVGLSGHLGAGKTAFVKCVAKELGIENEVTSPTYVIMKIYDIDQAITALTFGPDFPWRRLVHIDAYRLEKPEELGALDFENIVSDPHNLVLIEWPENVGIKTQYPNIQFKIAENGEEREIEIN